jgi:hypothetical protein
MALVDQAILPDDLLEQSLVGRADHAMSGQIDLWKKRAREGDEGALSDIDEKRAWRPVRIAVSALTWITPIGNAPANFSTCEDV